MFDLENIGEKSVEEAHAAVNDLVTKLAPLFRDIENRAGGILHGLMDRVKINVSIEILPVPKAEPVPPNEQ